MSRLQRDNAAQRERGPIIDRWRQELPKVFDQLIDPWAKELPPLKSATLRIFSRIAALGKLQEALHSKILKPYTVSYAEYVILRHLRSVGEPYQRSASELSRTIMQQSSGVTKTVDRLERAGYVKRVPSPTDRRSVLIKLTRSGLKAANELGDAVLNAQAERLGSISSAQRENVIKALDLLLRALHSDET